MRPFAIRAFDDVERVLNHVEVSQTKEIHLQQAKLLYRFHRELRDDLVYAIAILVGRIGVSELNGNDLGQWSVGDYNGGGVDRRVPYDSLKAARDVNDLRGSRVVVTSLAQRLAFLHAVVEAWRAALDWIGDQLREPVAGSVIVAENSRCVASCLPREHAAEGDDLRDRFAAVLLGDVLDHALAATHREIDVNIRHRHALGV
ncbi:unannotated protein [freshwater metagenome]|uniref:Unannotated protein n=1 Tax=freshwater metagenome TaxID=449393 RepID=A0A6J5ZTB9_9ZZZZ